MDVFIVCYYSWDREDTGTLDWFFAREDAVTKWRELAMDPSVDVRDVLAVTVPQGDSVEEITEFLEAGPYPEER